MQTRLQSSLVLPRETFSYGSKYFAGTSPRASFALTNMPPTPRADCLKNSRRLIFILGLIEVSSHAQATTQYVLQNRLCGKRDLTSRTVQLAGGRRGLEGILIC